MRVLLTILFIGHDFDTLVDGLSHSSYIISLLIHNPTDTIDLSSMTFEPSSSAHAEHAKEVWDHVVASEVLHASTSIAQLPQGAFSALSGIDNHIEWGDGTPLNDVLAVSAFQGLEIKVLEGFVERPLNKTLDQFQKPPLSPSHSLSPFPNPK